MIVDNPIDNSSIRAGDTGTVCRTFAMIVGVEWDHKVYNGHSCAGTCKDGYGWGVLQREIELCEENDGTDDIDNHSFMCIIGGAI